ncbi:MAG: hypothetical protein WEB30_10330 [Cyclobacteriaceae bacterium]
MDDNRFDDIIKGKVGEFEEPGFDAAALANFHHQMDSVHVSPWYSRYRTELLGGGAITMSTLLILLSLWYVNQQKSDVWEKNAALIALQQEQIAKLTRELDELKELAPDTLYIRPERIEVQTLLTKIAALESVINDLAARSANNSTPGLSPHHPVARTVTPAAFYPSDETTPLVVQFYSNPGDIRAQQHDHASSGIESGKFSAKTQRELEKHYHNGVGIRVGPALDLSKGIYEAGHGRIDFSGGVLGDFILSPVLSIETGGKFSHRFYEIPGDEVSSSGILLPDIDPDMQPLVTADIDSWTVEVPINLKYRSPLSMRSHWLAGIGYSSVFMTKQIFEYDYQLDGNQSVQLNESHHYSQTKMNPGTLNFSLGLSNQFRSNKILETSLYYQNRLGVTGLEKIQANFIGIRAVYWFTVR